MIVSGTASTRLSRVQRTLPNVTTFEAGILTHEEHYSAWDRISCTTDSNSAINESISTPQGHERANVYGSLGHPDPSALVLLSPQDLCACGLFNCDVIQVTFCGHQCCIY